MATASTQKLEKLLQCPICLDRITQPRVFDCSHFYCQPCLDDLKPKTEGDITGYECPTCQQITPKDKLRDMHFVHELIEVAELAQHERPTCETCKDTGAEWRCVDCKELFCCNCKQGHDRIAFLTNHTWEPIQDGGAGRAIIDKHVQCKQHPGEFVKLHCRQCDELICILCRSTEHHQHEAETIDDAISRVLPIVRENMETIGKKKAEYDDALASLVEQQDELEKSYTVMEKDIDLEVDMLVTRVREDGKKLKAQLAMKKGKQCDDIGEAIKTMNLEIQSVKNILALSKTTLTTAQSTSLLHALQDGIGTSLDSCLSKDSHMPKKQRKFTAKFERAPHSEDNLLGVIVESTTTALSNPPPTTDIPPTSRLIPRPLSEIAQQHFKVSNTHKTGYHCWRFTKVQNQLWLVQRDTNKVCIYGMDGTNQDTIELLNIEHLRSVAEVESGVVMAASNGLYSAHIDGANVSKILDGNFSDVSVKGDMVFALNNATNKVCMLTYDPQNKSYTLTNEFIIQNYTRHSQCNTIQATKENIYIAQWSAHNILQYRPDGTFVTSHGTRGDAIGELVHPWLCGVDEEHSLLIADQWNHRLVALSGTTGEFTKLNVEGIGNPYCAVVENDVLYVTDSAHALKQYSLM